MTSCLSLSLFDEEKLGRNCSFVFHRFLNKGSSMINDLLFHLFMKLFQTNNNLNLSSIDSDIFRSFRRPVYPFGNPNSSAQNIFFKFFYSVVFQQEIC